MKAGALHAMLRPGRLVALVGGGGKTTTGERLVLEAAAAGRRAILTTTTKTFAAAPFAVRLFESAREAARALGPGDLPALVARRGSREDKLEGFEAAEVPLLLEAADLVVVEADGARRLPIKAFSPDEPVLPTGLDDYVVVVGMASIGRPIEEGSVHRPEALARVLGMPLGTRLDEEMIARAVLAPGYLSAAPEGARVSVLLWGATTPALLAAAERIAARLLADARVARVITGDLRDERAGLHLFENAPPPGRGTCDAEGGMIPDAPPPGRGSHGAEGGMTPTRERE